MTYKLIARLETGRYLKELYHKIGYNLIVTGNKEKSRKLTLVKNNNQDYDK